jgi:hypothetical protein
MLSSESASAPIRTSLYYLYTVTTLQTTLRKLCGDERFGFTASIGINEKRCCHDARSVRQADENEGTSRREPSLSILLS